MNNLLHNSSVPCYTYRGMVIYINKSPQFGTTYYSIVNPYLHPNGKPLNHCHVHSNSKKGAEQIIDAFHMLRKFGYASKYSLNVRNKAMKLGNLYIQQCTRSKHVCR